MAVTVFENDIPGTKYRKINNNNPNELEMNSKNQFKATRKLKLQTCRTVIVPVIPTL